MRLQATALISGAIGIHDIESIRRSHATGTRCTPTLCIGIVANTNTDTESTVFTPGTPSPTGTSADGKVVPSESEPSGANADQRAGNQVEAEVVEFDEARRADVDGGRDGDAGEDDQVQGWRGGLVAGRDCAWFVEICGGRVRVAGFRVVCDGFAVVVQGEQFLGHALAVLVVVLRCG